MKISVENCVKNYGTTCALNHINVHFSNGIYALLGPNGAGKSTLINILCMLLHTSEGRILWNDKDIKECRKEYLSYVGYMPQYHCLYEDFTLQDFLYYIGSIKGMKKKELKKRSKDLVQKVKLDEVFHKKIRTFSGGMKQRVMLCVALLNDPRILILDEPTAGLDPLKRMEMQQFIAELSKDKIIIFATHVVSDVEYIADEFLLLNKGTLIFKGSRNELTSVLNNKVKEVRFSIEEYQAIKGSSSISSIHYEEDTVVTRIIDLKNKWKGIYVPPNINDVYYHIFNSNHVEI